MGIRRILKDTFSLFKESFYDTISYQMISKTLIVFILIPIFYKLIGYFLYIDSLPAVTNNNIALQALTLWWLVWFFFLWLMIVLTFFFEYVWLLFITSSAFNWKRKWPLWAITKVTTNCWKIFPLALTKALALLVVSIPFLLILVTTLYLLPDSFFLPIVLFLAVIFLLIVLYLVVKFLFVDYSVLIKWKWIKESFFKKYSYKGVIKMFTILFLWYFYFGLFFIWVNIVYSIFTYIVIFYTIDSNFLLQISTFLLVIYFFWNIILTSIFTSLNSSLITVLYYDLEDHKHSKIEEYKKKSRRKFLFKELLFVFIVWTAFTIFSYYQNKPFVENQFDLIDNKIRVSAHRWSSNVAPENTVPAFLQAIKDWVNQIEIDVQSTKDWKIILFHDYEAWRLLSKYNGVFISKLYRNQIKDLPVLKGFWGYENQTIPTLEETIDLVKPYKNISLNIEIKETDKLLNLTQKIIKIVKEKDFEDRVIFTSLTIWPLNEIKKELPKIPRWFIISAWVWNYYNYDVDFYSIATSMVNQKLIKKLRENGKWIYFWSFYGEDYMKNVIDYRPDEVIVNDPVLVRELIKERDKLSKISKIKKVVLWGAINWLK